VAVVKAIDFRKLAKAAAVAVDNKKAAHVVVLDVRKDSDVADYMVVAGARSSAQMGALFDAVEDKLKDLGARLLHREGRPKDRWLALDYGGLVIHLFSGKAREFYRLESLWENAKSVRWNPK
jgi:ribosome-associated protein